MTKFCKPTLKHKTYCKLIHIDNQHITVHRYLKIVIYCNLYTVRKCLVYFAWRRFKVIPCNFVDFSIFILLGGEMWLWSHHGRSNSIFHLIFLSVWNDLPLNFFSYHLQLSQFSFPKRHVHYKLKLAFNFLIMLMGNCIFINRIIYYTFFL